MAVQAADDTVKGLLGRASGTQPEDWFLVFKARYGMESVFRSLHDERGSGNVLTQLFTCATAVNPILAAGLTPVYGEVSPATIALDPELLPTPSHLRAVVLQNTFGIVSDETGLALRRVADDAGAILLEDSAHCIGRMARNEDGTPVADVSVHSFGVEKMLPTKYGGAVWVNPAMPPALGDRIRRDLNGLASPGARLGFAAATYRLQLGVMNRLPAALSGPIRGTVTGLGVFDPPIAKAETSGGQGSAVPLAANNWVAKQAAKSLRTLEQSERQREGAVSIYLQALAGKVEFPSQITARMPLVRFPAFVPEGMDAEQVFEALRAEGVYAGRWYRPALFPGVADPLVYNWNPAENRFPITMDLIERSINVPTAEPKEKVRTAAQSLLSAVSG